MVFGYISAVINLDQKVHKYLPETGRAPERSFRAPGYFDEFGERLDFNKSDVVFRQGGDNDALYFIETGLLKAHYVTAGGKEYVKSFLKEGDIIGNLTALTSKAGCSFTLVCLEPSSLIRVPFGDLLELAESELPVANQLIRLLVQLALKKERREYEFLCLSAEERFTILRETAPELLERVTQNDIARYLGITPVALSRIRSRTGL